MDEYGYSDKRSKKKDKFRNKKRHPYKKGGWSRTMENSSSSNSKDKKDEKC